MVSSIHPVELQDTVSAVSIRPRQRLDSALTCFPDVGYRSGGSGVGLARGLGELGPEVARDLTSRPPLKSLPDPRHPSRTSPPRWPKSRQDLFGRGATSVPWHRTSASVYGGMLLCAAAGVLPRPQLLPAAKNSLHRRAWVLHSARHTPFGTVVLTPGFSSPYKTRFSAGKRTRPCTTVLAVCDDGPGDLPGQGGCGLHLNRRDVALRLSTWHPWFS